MNARERKFFKKFTKIGKTLVFHPRWFLLKAGDKYMPDFCCPEDGEYLEIAGTRQAFHKNKEKYIRFQKEYPLIKFRVVHIDSYGNVKTEKTLTVLGQYLKTHNITQEEFAFRIEKSQQLVSGYCTGAFIPPRSTALKIVEITGGAVTLSDLWGVKIA